MMPERPLAHGPISLLLLGVFAALVLFARTTDRALNHDEHQFLAPAALLAREGAVPYKDYPLFHLPNLVYVDASLIRLGLSPVWAGKTSSLVATLGLVLLLATVARGAANSRDQLILPPLVVLLLLADPLFAFTTGKTWNHETSAACVLVAVFSISRGISRHSSTWIGCGGAFAGLAIGFRLTAAPVAAALALCCLLLPAANWGRRLRLAGLFAVAATVASAPSLILFVSAPEQFLFGNLEFPRLRLLDPDNERVRKTANWLRKLRYFFKEVILPSWPLFAAYILVHVRKQGPRPTAHSPEAYASATCGVALLGALLGCFAPTRYQYQHFYVLVPLLVFGVAVGLRRATLGATRCVFLLALVSAAISCWNVKGTLRTFYGTLADLHRPQEWFPAKAEYTGGEIADHVPLGRVLTLAPVWPLEGNLRVYPEFATGVFAWRSAHLVPHKRRQRLGVVAPADLEAFLEAEPPAAILTGVEEESAELPLVQYAQRRQFKKVNLSKRRVLWLPPKPEAAKEEL